MGDARGRRPGRPPAQKAMLAVNTFAMLFSLIWLIGHATVRVGDWEFWFALAYFALCALNVFFVVRIGGDPEE